MKKLTTALVYLSFPELDKSMILSSFILVFTIFILGNISFWLKFIISPQH